MLEHGNPDAEPFLSQLERAQVTPWKCECGCASFNFQIEGHEPAPPGVHVLGDFLFGTEEDLCSIIIFSSQGILSGVEVFGYAVDAPKQLPEPQELRLYSESAQ